MDNDDDRLPKSVLSYYVQLYCKKRKNKKITNESLNLVAEATKSWLGLSSSKKKILTMKYDNCYLKIRKRFANKLRNAVPFSSKSVTDKFNTNGSKSYSLNYESDGCSVVDVNQEIDESNHTSSSPHYLECSKNIQSPGLGAEANDESEKIQHLDCDSTRNVHTHESNNTYQEDEQNFSKPIASILEPCPPKFRNARDLYYIINKNSEDLVPWNDLSNTLKARYSEAGTRIKRLYLMEYTNYLENLSIEDLYTFYKKNIDT